MSTFETQTGAYFNLSWAGRQASDGLQPFLTSDQVIVLRLVFSCFSFALGLCGVVSNFLNIAVFAKGGLKDGLAVTFFSLAISDLGFCLTGVFNAVFQWLQSLADLHITWFDVNPYVLVFVTNILMTAFYLTSVLITTFLAVQRACCVLLPFLFSSTFSLRRIVYVMVGIGLIGISLVCSFLSIYGFKRRPVAGTNLTRVEVTVISPYREIVVNVIRTFESTIVSSVSQVVALSSLIVMASHLLRSSKFKRNCGVIQKQDSLKENSKGSDFETTVPVVLPVQRIKTKNSDIRVIKSVSLITLVFIITNTPNFVRNILRSVYPEFTAGGSYNGLYFLALGISFMLQITSSATNIFIYFFSNTKFKNTFKDLCKLHKKSPPH